MMIGELSHETRLSIDMRIELAPSRRGCSMRNTDIHLKLQMKRLNRRPTLCTELFTRHFRSEAEHKIGIRNEADDR